ncbi:MAG: ATP-binding protein [Patescibacteria group bacterium]
MKIQRIYEPLDAYIEAGKVLVIYGPRQIGKTTIVQNFLATTRLKYKFETGDDLRIQDLLGSQNLKTILDFIEGYELLVIDEAQKIPNIGTALKIIVDHIPKIRIIATGSSSFELAGQIGEPLTGRKNTMNLYSISQQELKKTHNEHELKKDIEEYLIFGSYPEIITTKTKEEKIKKLEEITYSYLLKDILEFDRIKNSKILLDLLALISFQIGNEVSLTEIGRQLGMNHNTVSRYLDLLEKSFILFEVRGFSRNLRKEITKKSKFYFYDNGIRNAIIANFNKSEIRNDIGQLWENFIFMERLKKRAYQNISGNVYFWRTWDQKEIDIIEEREGKLFGYECKWSDKKTKAPKDWLENYKNASFEVITQENYLKFIT